MSNNIDIITSHEIDGRDPFYVQDINQGCDEPSPHGWRGTSQGIALVGCRPCEPTAPGAYPLDMTDDSAHTAAGRLWFGSIRDVVVFLEGCRRYRVTNMHEAWPENLIGKTEFVFKYEQTAGPLRVDVRTFEAKNANPRYRTFCEGCGAHSKWYLPESRRYLISFQSKHVCPR